MYSQKIGLVLSGGGASGITHIGVIKALEENNIPIDYISGTSMGALIGAFYASGYSPEEIEQIFISDNFKNWATGKLNNKYIYYLRTKNEDAQWVRLKFSTDTIWEFNLPTNLVSPVAIDYELMKFFAPPSAMADCNFDSLFIPFRCVASDIVDKKEVIFNSGDLAMAVRASMSYPFYLKPLTYNGNLLFDGGLYNNFPADVIKNDFNADFLIGSNVSSNEEAPDEDNLVSQIRTLLINNTDYTIDKGVLIQPNVKDYSTFDFTNNKELIEIGYKTTLEKIDTIKQQINRQITKKELTQKRASYKQKLPELKFNNIYISGLNDRQNKYIKNSLMYKDKILDAEELKPEYIKVASDDKVKQLYPIAKYNNETGLFDLELTAKKEKDLFVSFGGNISSRSINEGFIGLQYNILGKTALTLSANSYFGKFYNSIYAGVRFDFPFIIPFYIETSGTTNKWDYFKSSSAFFDDVKPPYLVNHDNYIQTELGFPLAYRGKIMSGVNYGNLKNEYYQTKNFLSSDTNDVTNFTNFSIYTQFERNSLNRKQYASKGSLFSVIGRYVKGIEETIPGSTAITRDVKEKPAEWFQFKATLDHYFNDNNKVRFGILTEAVYSDQPFFNNYISSILSAPAFQPIAESKTLFQERFRAHSYFGGGLKTIFSINSNLEFRVSGYMFQPFNQILERADNLKAYYGTDIAARYFITSTSLVYHTKLGPLALNFNYYDQTDDPFSFMFHFGYILFNKRSLE